MVLEITPKQGLAEGKNPEHLYLPASEHQIERTLLRIGLDTMSDAQVRLDFDELPEEVADALDLERLSGNDLPALNQMCQAIAPMNDTDMEKLDAVVLMAKASGTVSICRLAENLGQFSFVPGFQTPEEYGRYMIRQSGKFQYDEDLEDCYDYRRYGEQRIRQESGQFNDYTMEKSLFERMGGTYHQESDYFLPDLSAPELPTIGIWGQRRRRYLKEHRQALYKSCY